MIEFFESTSTVIGTILGLFSLMSVVILWLDRRQKRFAQDAVNQANASSHDLKTKVSDMDKDLGEVAKDVTSVKRDLHDLSGRVHSVEKSMETVARQSDVASVNAELKHLSGSVTAELRVLSGMMHSFRESAIRAADKRSS